MTTVPCSIPGCKADGTRWAIEDVRLMRYGLQVIPKHIEIPRFVCDKHAEEYLLKGCDITPRL
jgi:hypothetical protein